MMECFLVIRTFFEEELKWTGICVEPIPEIFAQLQANRNCICVQGCIAEKDMTVPFLRISGPKTSEMLSGILNKYDPRLLTQIEKEKRTLGVTCEEIEIKSFNINALLTQKAIRDIDFLSLDAEGAELDILRS